MNQYAAAMSQHPIASHAVGETAGQILDQLQGENPDLLVVFASPHFVGAMEDVASTLRNLLDPKALIGGTAASIIGGGHEVEEEPALSVFAARMPGVELTPLVLRVEDTPDGHALVGWPHAQATAHSLILFTDPFTFPVDAFLDRVNDDLPNLQVIGGMASAARGPGGNRLVINDTLWTEGAVGVLVEGDLAVDTVVSQGCRPIGQPFVVTRADRNLVHELGGQPALTRLQELAAAASDDERALLRQGLHLGIVVDEQQDEFGRGDFLIRNVLGGDQESGVLKVGDVVEVGQTVQFQVRDAGSADEDLRVLLSRADPADGALLFTCNGRGRHLFGLADHDAGLVEEVLGPIPLAGAFCAGEIGPVGGRNYVHGFTASLALFRASPAAS